MKPFVFTFFKAKSLQKCTVISHKLTVIIFVASVLFFFNKSLSAQAVVKINTGGNLVISGTASFVLRNAGLNNSGSINSGTGSFIFLGDADTSTAKISGNGTSVLYNVTISKSANGVAFQSPVSIKNILKVSAGILHADSNLTLLSTAALTARVDTIITGASISGKVNVQRYFPAKRAWRLITAPVSNGSSIYTTWQNAGVYEAGKGMFITGIAGGTGFDKIAGSSLKTYNNTTQRLDSVYNSLLPVSQGSAGSAENTGYFAFVRGDRNTNNFIIPNCNATTLTASGKLQTGNQIFTTSSIAGAYTLVGNPYASPINFSALTKSNLYNRVYVWDPNLNTVGGYVVFDDFDNTGTYTKSVSGSQQNIYMQSGQAFFVQTITAGVSSLTITENCKTGTANLGAFRPADITGISKIASLKVNLYLHNFNDSLICADGIYYEFGSTFHDSITIEDAPKITNINENLSGYSSGVMLALERRSLIKQNDTLRLQLWNTTKRNYQLQFDGQLINAGVSQATCTDHYLGTKTPLLVNGFTNINFSVNSDSASASINRFTVEFKPLQTFPIYFTELVAAAQESVIVINWKVAQEVSSTKYIVEKSLDGIHFETLAETAAAYTTNGANSYTLADYQPSDGLNFYRIKGVELNGKVLYSQVVKCQYAAVGWLVKVYPNPVRGNTLKLMFYGKCKGLYGLQMLNAAGAIIWKDKASIANAGVSTNFLLGKHYPKGNYILIIKKENKEIQKQKILFE